MLAPLLGIYHLCLYGCLRLRYCGTLLAAPLNVLPVVTITAHCRPDPLHLCELPCCSTQSALGGSASHTTIIASDDRREHKLSGRHARPFNADLSKQNREQIVLHGIFVNVSQNPEFCTKLLATGHRSLVEASLMTAYEEFSSRHMTPSLLRLANGLAPIS